MKGVGRIAELLLLCFISTCWAQNTAPVFNETRYSFDVFENSPQGSVVGRVAATDGEGDELTYSIASTTAGAANFRMNSTTGVITLSRPIDREDLFSQTLRFFVSVADQSFDSVVEVIVNVEDLNDNAPVFQNLPGSLTVDENSNIGTSVFQARAIDADLSRNGDVLYSIQPDDTFSIDQSSGDITQEVSLDFDRGAREYFLTIIAQDRAGSESMSSASTLNISVRDVNDQPPAFEQTVYLVQIHENFTMGSSVVTVRAMDQDEGINDNILYEISGGNAMINGTPSFSINETTGLISVNVPMLDREEHGMYSLFVIGRESMEQGISASTTVTITILDINDHIPLFDMASYQVNISELIQVNSTVTSLMASDRDEGVHAAFQFTIVNVTNEELPFAVTAETVQNMGVAEITLTQEIDFETRRSYRFLVMATETLQGVAQSSYALVVIYVTNENDNSPYFVSDISSAMITENSPSDSFIAIVIARDDDDGTFGEVTFSLGEDDLTKPFEIITGAGGMGTLRTTRPLDFEAVESYTLTIVVQDVANVPNFNRTTINVTVVNVNDNPPVFLDNGGAPVDTVTRRVLEETAFPFTVLTLQAFDADSPLNELTFSIVSDLPSLGHFQIEGSDPVVLNTNIVLDFDLVTAVQLYTLNISVNDSAFLDYLTVFIELVDINDNSPIFANDSYSFDVVENSEIGTLVGEVLATDIDSGTFGQIEYTLFGPADVISNFWINSSTGEIYVLASIDREQTPGPLQFEVIASDLDSNITLRNTDNTSVTVTVLDRNDNSPVFSEDLYTFSVAENTAQLPGFNVSALDSDSGSNGMVVYTILEGNEEDTFILDPITGVLTLNTSVFLDFERIQIYVLNVSAEDLGQPSNTAFVQVVIEIIDENDNSPTFSMQVFNASIFENVLPGFAVITLIAEDDDSGDFGRVVYSIANVQGPAAPQPNGTFTINEETGAVSTVGLFDRETFTGPYIVIIAASDRGTPPNNGSATLIIDLLDVNDETPTFMISEAVLPSPDEEQPAGDVVARFRATDGDQADTDNSLITYSIVDIVPMPTSAAASVIASEQFALNTSSNVVWLVTNASLDYEFIRSYDITIRAEDNGMPSLSSETTVMVDVVDTNDNAPQFVFDGNALRYSAEIAENAGASIILNLVATDEDSTTNGMITFNFNDFPGPPFSISEDELLLTGLLDFEMVQSYVFNVTARDGGTPTMSDIAEVEITIIDVNDNSPIFTPINSMADVDEGDYTSNSTVVVLVNATDLDSEEFGNVSYEVFPASELFSVIKLASGVGEVRVNGVLDRETLDAYSITILARDGATPPNTATSTVSITINDVNDNNPILSAQQYMATILEGEIPSEVARILENLDISATDADVGRNSQVFFFLSNTTDFEIDVTTGTVRSLRVFDYEVEQSFVLEVVAVNNATEPALNDTAQLTIFIADINDNNPFFIDFPANVSFPEDLMLGSPIANITADDLDSGINRELVFRLTNDQGKFSINNQGYITLLDSLDRETRSSYNITVTVSDRGQQPLTATGYLFIEVTDVNDVEPELDRDSYNFLVPEDVELNTTLGILTATDQDEGINGDIVFAIVTGDTDIFSLVTTQEAEETFSARIINNEMFDYENVTSYSLTVMVRNTVQPYFITMAGVTVTIRDTNDNRPTFSVPEGYTIRVPEAAVTQRPVGSVVATDEDGGLNGTVNYRLAADTEQTIRDTFSMNIETGVITLISSLNFESVNVYEFYVEANDLSEAPLTSNVSVTVNVEDTNENAPIFDMNIYSASLEENLPPGTLVIRVNATEPETGGSSVRYALETGDAQQFQIDAVTGIITTRASLDRETRSSYVLTVQAADMATNPLSAFIQVLVEVEDDNDNSPMFIIGPIVPQVSLPESSAVGVRLPDVFLASDADTGTNAAIRYSISPNSFAVDENTGVISVRDSSMLDRETTPIVRLFLQATDGGSNPRASTLMIDVTLVDINDNTPVFMPAAYTASVTESSDVAVSVVTVNAIDADIELALRYAIMSGDDADNKFRIDAVTGLIETTASPLDRETRAIYELVVSVTDSGTPPRMNTAIVTITVQDVNDNTPQCDQSLFTFSTEEANRLQIELGSVSATDGDAVPGLAPVGSGQLIYTIASTNLEDVITVSSGGVVFGDPGLDFDILSDGTFTFDVLVSDQPVDASRQLSATCRVMVTLSDQNDNVPTFGESRYEARISESAAQGDIVTADISAQDRDSGTNGDFTYSIQNSVREFSINPLTGVVIVSGSLDSDLNDLYLLDVEARDNGVPPNVGVTILRITVTDVDDRSPLFDRSFYQSQILEDAGLLFDVATITATDTDSNRLDYTLQSGNEGNRFSIGRFDGLVQVIGRLDRETTEAYNLVILAIDEAGNIGTTLLRVTILDVNDEAPQFQPPEYTASINENSLEGTPVLPVVGGSFVQIQAVDRDQPNTINSLVRYRLEGANAPRFNIDSSTGRVTVARGADLNFEAERSVPVFVVASDSNPIAPQSSTAILRVNLLDLNDRAPRFSNPFGYIVVADEDDPIGSVISTITASDTETVGGAVRYRLTDASPFSALSQFSINRTNGQLSLLESLDRETDPTITLVVTASDMGEPALSSVVNVQITVRDVNDNPPRFSQDIFTTTVPEFLAVGAPVLQVTAVDPDGPGANSEVVYQLMGDSSFTINPSTGVITTTATLDHETRQFHSVTIMACDEGTPMMCDITTIRINVGDFNDQPPIFDQTLYSTDVCYNRTADGTELVQPVATDGDSGINAQLIYSLANSPSLFSINPATGRISLAQAARIADIDRHIITIIAEDRGDTPLSGSAQVAIRVLNCSEQNLYFASPFHYFEIEEGENRFTDGSSSLEIAWSRIAQVVFFSPNLPTNPFINVLNNIQLKMFANLLEELRQGRGLDREARSLYTVILQAQDAPFSTYTSITLRVLDTNDNTPMFSSDLAVFQTAENQTAPHEIGSVVASDVDEGVNADLEYRIVSIMPSSNIPIFSIDVNTGLISAEAELDRETETEYILTVEATDGVGSASIMVQVTVLDINDCQPMFAQGLYMVDINENLPSGSSVASIGATDCDEGANAELRYSIIGGDVGVFQLGLLSGVITTLTPLDFEVTPRYSLRVIATDLGQPTPLTGSVDVLFTVVDFNDCPPEFINAPAVPQTPVFENTAINSVIQTYTVQDCDSGLNGVNGTRFSIVAGNEEGVFEINALSGVLRTVASLDREEQDTYILDIQAMDSAGVNSLSSITELTVTVFDVNDNAPMLDEDEISITVSEGEGLRQTLLTLTATDADSGSNGDITFSLTGGDGAFVIDPLTGELSLVRTLDREMNDSYVLSVVASDRGSQSLSSNATIVNVLVSDENDNDPEIINIVSGVTRAEVPENSPRGLQIFTVNATDRDIGLNANIRFSLDDQSTDLPFELVVDTIRVNGPLDFEQRVIYSLVVVAEDRGTPNTRRGIATLVVEVTDMNDSPPDFIQAVFLGTPAEDAPIGTEIVRVQANDADSNVDNSRIAYSLDDSADADFFTINNMTGMIFSDAMLDREVRDSYAFGVIADNFLSSVVQTGTAQVRVTVEDVNDETPVFGLSSYSATVPERTSTDTLILTVTATDDDLSPNSDLIFLLSRVTNVPFFIDTSSGRLFVRSNLDYEEQTSYNFGVVVEDRGTPPLRNTSTITITIADVNDQVPRFEQPIYTFRLTENSPARQILSLQYTDGDGSPENTMSTVTIVSVSPQESGLFSISDGASGTATIGITAPVDYERVQSYALTIRVMNNNPGVGEACAPLQPSCILSSTTLVNIELVDVNDNTPIFAQSIYKGEISSTALTGTSILSVFATDGDASAAFRSIRYRLDTSPNSPSFRISETTGTIFTRGSFDGRDGDEYTLSVFAVDNFGNAPFNENMTTIDLIVLNDFQRIAIIFNISVDAFSEKEDEVVSLLEELSGYTIVVEQYREYSTNVETTFIFHAVDNGNIIDFDEFLTKELENDLFVRLEQCRIVRIQSFGDLIVSQGPVDTEIIVILVLCLFLIIGAFVVLITAFSQRYLALHAARHKLLADVFYGSHAGSSFVENIQQENIQLQFLESSGQATNKQNPMFVQPYDNWAVDTSGVESVGGDSNLQKDNPLYESQEIRMEMFADDASDEDEGDEADEAELLAAALQEDSDAEDEDNSVTAI